MSALSFVPSIMPERSTLVPARVATLRTYTIIRGRTAAT
jgi:hypothetical protein